VNKRIKMLKKFFLFLIFLLPISCGGWQDFESAVTGAKKKTTDEYLIKKKDPLILPPDYDKLPLPGSKTSNREENLNIENIISGDSNSEGNTSNKSSVERSIEEELRKKN
tara:strand:+ start:582 stop:911 length:330 start_codon:yes stop_codon:yes gene_type:complete